MKNGKRALLIILLVLVLLVVGFFGWLYIPRLMPVKAEQHREAWKTNDPFVFVHGLSGWGSYDAQYKAMPYWGMLNGDLMAYLNSRGYACYAASVAPSGSAWDRTCELYAQLTGTRVDYGAAHSAAMGHERYGADFTGRSLIPAWSAEKKISLLGHSFGGATVRMLVSLLAKGDEEEQAATAPEELSGLFAGGKADWVRAVITLAAPHNGTSAYHADNEVQVPWLDEKMSGLMSSGLKAERDGRSEKDYAAWDMHIDHALALNDSFALPENIYYFSYACTATRQNADGTWSPDRSRMEYFYRKDSEKIGHYTGVTEGGFVIDETWQENDGLVNTVSAAAPMGQPSQSFDAENIRPGIWNIMPVYEGDHMALQGGLLKRRDVRGFYTELLDRINSIINNSNFPHE